MLINLGMYESMIAEALHTGIVFYLSGLLSLLAGLAIVNLHNMWCADWRVIFTILGGLRRSAGSSASSYRRLLLRSVRPSWRSRIYDCGRANHRRARRFSQLQGLRTTRVSRRKAAMTFELRILALSVVLGLVQIVLASHATSLQRGYLWTAGSRDEAVPPFDWNSGPAGAGATQFYRDVSAVRCSRPDRARYEHPPLDDRMGRPTLLWGSCCLPRLVCGGCISLALTRVERGDPRDRDGALVTRSEPCVCRRTCGSLRTLLSFSCL